MKLLSLIMIVIFLLFGYSNQNAQSNLKTIKQSFYATKMKFGEMVKEEPPSVELFKYDLKGNKIAHIGLYGKFLWKYDSKGNLIEKTFFSDGKLKEKTIYKYDSKSNKIGSNTYNLNGSIISEGVYKKGKVIKVTDYDSNGNIDGMSKYKYDKKGNKVEEKHYFSGGDLRYKKNYTYNNNRNVIEMKQYDQSGLERHEINKYDKIGNKIEVSTPYVSWSNEKFLTTIKYNKKGNIVESETVIYTANGKIDDRGITKYHYDSKENWVKKIIFKNNTPTDIYEREIEYYN